MTKEENLHWLNQEIRTWENECQSKHPIKEALYAARKALEQEPNTWSLDDAREDFMHDVYNTLDFLPTNEEANQIIDSFDRVTSSIKQELRWIPVTERLPEESNEYLVSTVWEDVTTDYFRTDSGWMTFEKKEILAWMPLPESYKEVSE